jgi:N-acetylneuraminic acid mutarotase
MISSRSMFASTAIENKFIYVYGGISKGTSRFPCSNSLPKNIVEKYDTNADSWSEIHI